MLVLSRKNGESIRLPEQNVIVTILEIRGNQVRVGITAPDSVPVYREELWQRFSPHFDLLEEWVPRSYPNRTGLELMMWWRRG